VDKKLASPTQKKNYTSANMALVSPQKSTFALIANKSPMKQQMVK